MGEVGGGEEGVSLSRGRGKVWVWEGCSGLDGGGGGVVCEAGVLGRVGVLGERGSGGGGGAGFSGGNGGWGWGDLPGGLG